MAGLIEPEAELERLAKRRRRAQTEAREIAGASWRTAISPRTPRAEVVAKDQLRLTDLRTEIDQLAAQIARVNALRASMSAPRSEVAAVARPAQSRHFGQGCADPPVPRLPAGARPSADRGHSRRGQDHSRARHRQDARIVLPARAVHQRLVARRRARRVDIRSRDRQVPLSARPDLRSAGARRRNQPRLAQGAERAAGGHGGAAGDPRRAIDAPARAVFRDRDAKPAGAGGHLPAARIAARPLPDARASRVSGGGGRARAAVRGGPARSGQLA